VTKTISLDNKKYVFPAFLLSIFQKKCLQTSTLSSITIINYLLFVPYKSNPSREYSGMFLITYSILFANKSEIALTGIDEQ